MLFGPGLLTLRVLILATSAYAGLRMARKDVPKADSLRAFRTLLYCPFAALLFATIAVPWIVPAYPNWPVQSIFLASLGIAQSAWAIAWSREAEPAIADPSDHFRSSHRPWRLLDLACGNAFTLLILVEILLVVWGGLRPSPLVFHESVAASLKAHRQPAHQPFHDRALNSGGFADDEFESAVGSDALVVAVIGDSFGLGVVPIAENYVTVAEQALRESLPDDAPRIFLNNYGVPAVGLPEYAELFRREVRPIDPALVVVSVFVGNDIHEGLSFTRPKQRRYRLQQWLIWSVGRRAATLLSADRKIIEGVEELGAPDETPPLPSPPAAVDMLVEKPTFPNERYLEIERGRMAVTDADQPATIAGYEQFFAGLRYFASALGDSLVIAMIPDEFQVNDELWRSIGGEAGAFDRELPQRRILEFCKRHRIECIDFLPVLRAAQEHQPTYHLRDTHWNRFGNRAAGLELARRLREKLQGRSVDRVQETP